MYIIIIILFSLSKTYITKICEETSCSPLNSELQLAGLRFLTNMSVTNDYHYMMTSSIPCFLHLLLDGDEPTQVLIIYYPNVIVLIMLFGSVS